jgi:hypothetical protein
MNPNCPACTTGHGPCVCFDHHTLNRFPLTDRTIDLRLEHPRRDLDGVQDVHKYFDEGIMITGEMGFEFYETCFCSEMFFFFRRR